MSGSEETFRPPAKLLAGDLLVVDDQPAIIEQLKQELESDFGPLVAFTNPSDAIRHLHAGERYAVALLDVVMSPVSGLELLNLLRELDPACKVIMLTAHGSMQSAVRALQLGAIDYIAKPIADWPMVIASVRRALNEHRLQQENERLVAELQQQNVALSRSVNLLRTLSETSEMMHAAKDVAKILNILVERACEVLAARRVSIMILDPQREEMAIKVAAGIDQAVLSEVRVRPNEGIAGKVISRGEPMVVDDAPADERLPNDNEREARYRSRSFMCIPIFLRSDEQASRVIGVVNVTDRLFDRPFSPTEVEFVSHLARQAAFAMANAALWRRRGG